MAMSKRVRELYEKRRKQNAQYFRPSTSAVPAPTPVQHTQSQPSTTRASAPKVPAQPRPQVSLESRVVSGTNPIRKLHQVYNTLQGGGYYITSANELVYGKRTAIPLDEAGVQTVETSDVMYNASLTLSILTCMLQDAGMLLIGKPGRGKTTLAEYVGSAVFGLPIKTIQKATIYGNPELTEEKMLAAFDIIKFMRGEKDLVVRDFLKLPIRLIDEVNRIPSETQSDLLQVVDRGFTTYQNEMIIACQAALFATANPPDEGNYDMTEPFLDRFDVALVVKAINPFRYSDFTERRVGKIKKNNELGVPVPERITPADITAIRKIIYSVEFPSDLMSMLSHFSAELETCDMAGTTPDTKNKSNTIYEGVESLCQKCDHYSAENNLCSKTKNDFSARAISSAYAYSKALAAWRGSRRVNKDDVRYALAYSSWFRLSPTIRVSEEEPRHKNDRIAWVKSMFDASMQSYGEVSTQLAEYSQITNLLFRQTLYKEGRGPQPNITRVDVGKMRSEVAKLDSLVKYPLISALNNLYHELK
ncbi:AAA family ATPase [Nanoarchaeota archaeon]